jgi:hypothetical protein
MSKRHTYARLKHSKELQTKRTIIAMLLTQIRSWIPEKSQKQAPMKLDPTGISCRGGTHRPATPPNFFPTLFVGYQQNRVPHFHHKKLPTKAEWRATAHHSRPRPHSTQNQSQGTSAQAFQCSSALSDLYPSRPTPMMSSRHPSPMTSSRHSTPLHSYCFAQLPL